LKRQTLNRHSERSRGCNAAAEGGEARLSIPLHYFSMALRDPSTPLRSAQDDYFLLQMFNLLAMKSALHKISR
jgi:hypothetical protein